MTKKKALAPTTLPLAVAAGKIKKPTPTPKKPAAKATALAEKPAASKKRTAGAVQPAAKVKKPAAKQSMEGGAMQPTKASKSTAKAAAKKPTSSPHKASAKPTVAKAAKKASKPAAAKAAAKKASKPAVAKAAAKKPPPNPHKDAFFKRLESVIERVDALGSCLIVGVSPEEFDGEEDEEAEFPGSCEEQVLTAAQVRRRRALSLVGRCAAD